jgi:hypothetical protein
MGSSNPTPAPWNPRQLPASKNAEHPNPDPAAHNTPLSKTYQPTLDDLPIPDQYGQRRAVIPCCPETRKGTSTGAGRPLTGDGLRENERARRGHEGGEFPAARVGGEAGRLGRARTRGARGRQGHEL